MTKMKFLMVITLTVGACGPMLAPARGSIPLSPEPISTEVTLRRCYVNADCGDSKKECRAGQCFFTEKYKTCVAATPLGEAADACD